MRTCASVDLPDPFGPMTACTSPEWIVRSMPRRISLPETPARRPRISSTCSVWSLIDDHHDVVALDADVVDGYGPGGRQGQGLAALERELAAVLPALDRALLGVDLALGQGDV